MRRYLRLFTNARRLHRCGELNELTDLADFLPEWLSGQLTSHVGFDEFRLPANLALRVTVNVIYSAAPAQSRVHT
jgi:hypothetical protein